MTAELQYRAAPEGALRLEPLGDLFAIYDRRSAQTHVVAPPMPEILAALADAPADAGVLAQRLSTMFDLGDAADAAHVLAARLAELAALGLVEPL